MLSVGDCRKILGNLAPKDDEALSRFRDDVYAIVRIILNLKSLPCGSNLSTTESSNEIQEQLTPEERDEWAERAAIIEYDGGIEKHLAEAKALQLIKGRGSSALH